MIKNTKLQPKKKLFSSLGVDSKQRIIRQSKSYLENISRSDVKNLLGALNKCYFKSEIMVGEQLKQNINKMFKIFLPILKEKSKIAAVLTEGLNLNEASEITSIPTSSISWGR